MVLKGQGGGEGEGVTHVVGVGMEGEDEQEGQGQGGQGQQQEGHTAALARALAGRLGARFLPFDGTAGAGADADAGGASRVALLCCAWVHAGGRLEAAARALEGQGFRCVWWLFGR